MKTVNGLKLKKLGKTIALTLVTASLAVSCGKDKNKTNSNDTTYSGTNPVFQSSAADLSQWNNLKSKYQCNTQYGSQGRLPDLNFVVQGGQTGGYNTGYGNTVSGQLTPGGIGGSIQGSYAGINFGTRDIIYVTKVFNGSQVAYNVTVSLCSWQGQYQSYIGGNAQLSNFSISSPLVLNSSSNCPIGIVSDGWITFSSSTFGPIPTRFSSNSCL